MQVADDTVTGTVSLDGEDEVSFTASAAVGNAGVYVAEGEVGEFEAVARWIVLDDGEQRGGVEQCFRNPWTGERHAVGYEATMPSPARQLCMSRLVHHLVGGARPAGQADPNGGTPLGGWRRDAGW